MAAGKRMYGDREQHAKSPHAKQPPRKYSVVHWSDALEDLTTLTTDHGRELAHYEAEYDKDKTEPTNIEEVWFSGCHCGMNPATSDCSPVYEHFPRCGWRL